MYRMLQTGIPEMRITHNQTVPVPLLKDDKLNASMVITNAGGSNFLPQQLYNGFITKKGRGNTTWGFDKKPFNIVTTDSAYAKVNTSIFGFPPDSDYSLMADAQDKLYFRTPFGHAFGEALGQAWAPRFQKVRLYIDNVYQGMYTLVEKVKEGVNRINITKVSATDLTSPNVTGGYVAEMLPDYQIDSVTEMPYAWTINGKYWLGKVPDPDKYKPAQITYMQTYQAAFENAVFNVSFDDLTNGYRAFIDPISYIQYWFHQDFLKNGDAYWGSDYTTKPRSQKMIKGPVWDMGGIIGTSHNTNYRGAPADNVSLIDPDTDWVGVVCPYWAKLLTDPYFFALAQQVLTDAIPRINDLIADTQAFVQDSHFLSEVADDRAQWPWILTDAAYQPKADYQAELDFAFDYLKRRLRYYKRKYLPLTPASATVTP